MGEVVYLRDVMWECGLGQEGAITERSMKGSYASSSTTLPRDEGQPHAHMHAHLSSLLRM